MTFPQQVLVSLIQAASTALFVAVIGGIVATTWSRRYEQRREAFEIRTKLLNDSARVAQGMYVFLQYTRRRLIQAGGGDEQVQALKDLDDRFLTFSTEAAAIQTLLGARFGVIRALPAQDARAYLPPFLRWHQIHDLLALYYYNLKESFPGIVLAETSVGHGGNFHSGLDMTPYSHKRNLDTESLRQMRIDIRVAYDEAMIDLACGITEERITSQDKKRRAVDGSLCPAGEQRGASKATTSPAESTSTIA